VVFLLHEYRDLSRLILRVAAYCGLVTAMKTKIYIAGKLKSVYGYQEMMHDIHVKINPDLQ
jgi:ABC-type thiamin/hydroxymethylpyrimidine transport system permease subunit